MASTHIRIRRQSPKFAMSAIAPIVQKFARWPTAPNTAPSAKAPPVTTAGRDSGPGIRKLSHAPRTRPYRPDGRGLANSGRGQVGGGNPTGG